MNVLTHIDIQNLQKILNYEFKNPELLDTAFTHSSTANLFDYESNERLEFFGDSILSFVVSEKLYLNISNAEGDLSYIRSNLVSAQNLSKLVDKMGLEKYYGVNTQVIKMGFPINVKADLFESILGAIYLDGGLENAKNFVYNLIDLSSEALAKDLKRPMDAKTRLQEFLQGHSISDFKYKTLSQSGPMHNPTFEVALYVNGNEISSAQAHSKRSAEQKCAEKALDIMSKE